MANQRLSRTELARVIFGDSGHYYLPILDGFRGSFNNTYTFLDRELYTELLFQKPVEASRVYWKEMLYRAHLAASVSLLRHLDWVEGALIAVQHRNLLSCAAAIRGFVESVADSDEALRVVPNALADYALVVRQALEGREPVLLIQDAGLEYKLIHFTHARRAEKGEELPSVYRARTMQDYLKYFAGEKQTDVCGLYKFLCGLTHPTADSVNIFVDTDVRATETLCALRESRDIGELRAILAPYVPIMPDLFGLGINTPILILKIINRFPLPQLHNPIAELISIEGTEWTEISSKLSRAT